MSRFEEYICQKFVEEIRSWSPDVARDIYVVVIYISLLDDDPRFAELFLNHNTVLNWQKRIPNASSSMEAKWNYAFWPDDDKIKLCESPKYNTKNADLTGIEFETSI